VHVASSGSLLVLLSGDWRCTFWRTRLTASGCDRSHDKIISGCRDIIQCVDGGIAGAIRQTGAEGASRVLE
jgi:hypothetical protein